MCIRDSYAEDDVGSVVERIGATQILFGSDWPHGEGLADPTSYGELLADRPDDEAEAIMRGNLTGLLGL